MGRAVVTARWAVVNRLVINRWRRLLHINWLLHVNRRWLLDIDRPRLGVGNQRADHGSAYYCSQQGWTYTVAIAAMSGSLACDGKGADE